MLFTVLFGVLLSVVSFSELVVGDPTSVIVITSAKVTQNDCGYFGTCTIDIAKTKKNSQITINIPVTKEVAPEMQISFVIYLNGPSSEPITYNMTLCDALIDEMIGKSLVQAGLPKASFPKTCPITPGPWVMSKWDPPTLIIPPGIPDGQFTASAFISLEGKPFCIKFEIAGELKHALPGIGR